MDKEDLLKVVSMSKKISSPEAAELIDDCIKKTSAKFDIPYAEIYSMLKGFKLASLREEYGKCPSYSKEECEDSPYCIDWKGRCIPKKLPDADLINKDPDAYVKTHIKSTEQLKKLVKLASYLYHNYEGGGLTDNSYDALEYHLNKRLKLRQRAYEKIGAPVVEKIRTVLPYPMPSLSKVKPGTKFLYNFLNSDVESYVWSHKLDGVSGMVVYNKDGLQAIYTRGDGTIGGDVTYLKDYIEFPDLRERIVVRGEFILPKKVWEMKYQVEEEKPWRTSQLQMYANARSFVSAKINSARVLPELKDIQFVAYNIVSLPGVKIPKPSKAMKILYSKGFNVVEYRKVLTKDISVFYLMHTYKDERIASQYFIDGLVVSKNVERDEVLDLTSPDYSVAFKMILEEQIRETKVINVEWNISRHGRFVPVAIYESVYVSGIRLHRATGHNAAHIRDWSMGVGTKIKIVRSGDVIPAIKDVEVDRKIEPIFPGEERGEWHWERLNIILNEIETNREVQIQRMVYFFSVLEVPRLREKTLEKLWEAGYHFPEDVVRASVEDLKKIRGLGVKTSSDIKKNIDKSLSEVPPDRFLIASTTLKSGIGRKLVKTLFRYVPDILFLGEEEIRKRLIQTKIPGFGKKRIENVAESLPRFRKYLFSFARTQVETAMKRYQEKLERLEREGRNVLIQGKTFVLTAFFGKTNYDLEDYIYDHLGYFSTTVTSKTDAIIAGNITEITGKMERAWDLGVPVYSIDEFREKYVVV